MSSLVDFALNEEYKRLGSAGDKLAEIESRIDWKPFSSMLGSMSDNETDSEDMPEADSIVMIKMLVLQQWYDISDNELEKQCIDRISFRKFLGFPAYIPDSGTVSSFRSRLRADNLEEEIWDELQKQLDTFGLNIENGTMQDATFTYSTSGHEKADRTKKKGMSFLMPISDLISGLRSMDSEEWVFAISLGALLGIILTSLWP